MGDIELCGGVALCLAMKLGKQQRAVCRLSLLAGLWSIWGERNVRCCKIVSSSLPSVVRRADNCLEDWISCIDALKDCHFLFLLIGLLFCFCFEGVIASSLFGFVSIKFCSFQKNRYHGTLPPLV